MSDQVRDLVDLWCLATCGEPAAHQTSNDLTGFKSTSEPGVPGEELVTKVAELISEWERSEEQASDFARRLISIILAESACKAGE